MSGIKCPVHGKEMISVELLDYLPKQRFFRCPEEGCDQYYSKTTGHITADDLPSSNAPRH
jgi:acid phosphatase class B